MPGKTWFFSDWKASCFEIMKGECAFSLRTHKRHKSQIPCFLLQYVLYDRCVLLGAHKSLASLSVLDIHIKYTCGKNYIFVLRFLTSHKLTDSILIQEHWTSGKNKAREHYKSSSCVFSGSGDGRIRWWDMRQFTTPLETMVVEPTQGDWTRYRPSMETKILKHGGYKEMSSISADQ